nr:MAG TPA: hypothetical protein [Caudoviricetes sp.]
MPPYPPRGLPSHYIVSERRVGHWTCFPIMRCVSLACGDSAAPKSAETSQSPHRGHTSALGARVAAGVARPGRGCYCL